MRGNELVGLSSGLRVINQYEPIPTPPTPVGDPPVITSGLAANFTWGQAFSYQIVATNDPTSYAADLSSISGLTINTLTGLISGTPNDGDSGVVTLSLNAPGSDYTVVNEPAYRGSGSSSDVDVWYRIDITMSPTTIIGMSEPWNGWHTTIAAQAGSQIFDDINVGGSNYKTIVNIAPPISIPTNVPTTTKTVYVRGSDRWYFDVACSAGTDWSVSYTWTSTRVEGVGGSTTAVTIPISASNDAGTDSKNLVLTPVIPVDPPVITSALSDRFTWGEPYSYQITATNSPTSFGATDLPTALEVNTTTGLINGRLIPATISVDFGTTHLASSYPDAPTWDPGVQMLSYVGFGTSFPGYHTWHFSTPSGNFTLSSDLHWNPTTNHVALDVSVYLTANPPASSCWVAWGEASTPPLGTYSSPATTSAVIGASTWPATIEVTDTAVMIDMGRWMGFWDFASNSAASRVAGKPALDQVSQWLTTLAPIVNERIESSSGSWQVRAANLPAPMTGGFAAATVSAHRITGLKLSKDLVDPVNYCEATVQVDQNDGTIIMYRVFDLGGGVTGTDQWSTIATVGATLHLALEIRSDRHVVVWINGVSTDTNILWPTGVDIGSVEFFGRNIGGLATLDNCCAVSGDADATIMGALASGVMPNQAGFIPAPNAPFVVPITATNSGGSDTKNLELTARNPTSAIFYDGYNDTTDVDFIIVDAKGGKTRVAPVGPHNRTKGIIWHRAMRRWVYLYENPSNPSETGAYMSASAEFPGACPGTGWTKLSVPEPNSQPLTFNYEVAIDYFGIPVSQMHDGGVAFVMYEAASSQQVFCHVDDVGAVHSTVIGAVLSSNHKLMTPRGSTRVFLGSGYTLYSNSTLRYSDPPYTSWTACTGIDAGTQGQHSNMNYMLRRDGGELIMLRGSMRYGPNSGSQDEIWNSTDNGASWNIKARPWGTFGSMSLDARVAFVPRFVNGKFMWDTYGDSQTVITITTTDWATFTSTVMSSARNLIYTSAPHPVYQDRLIVTGQNPPTGGFVDNPWGLVELIVNSNGTCTYDDTVPMYPPSSENMPLTGNRVAAYQDNRAWSNEITGLPLPEITSSLSSQITWFTTYSYQITATNTPSSFDASN